MMRSLMDKLKTWIVADVPDDLAACEFDCRELECSEEQWENCPRRLQKVANLKGTSEFASK